MSKLDVFLWFTVKCTQETLVPLTTTNYQGPFTTTYPSTYLSNDLSNNIHT